MFTLYHYVNNRCYTIGGGSSEKAFKLLKDEAKDLVASQGGFLIIRADANGAAIWRTP